MGYWGEVATRAWKDTRKAAKIETTEAIVLLVIGQAVLAGVLWYWTGDASPWTRVASALLPFLLLPPIFLAKFVATPGALKAEDQAQIATLTAASDEITRKKRIREALASFITEGEGVHHAAASSQDYDADGSAVAWGNRVLKYLGTELDESYSVRFKSDFGFLNAIPIGDFTEDQRRVLSWLNRRVQRLQEFIAELR